MTTSKTMPRMVRFRFFHMRAYLQHHVFVSRGYSSFLVLISFLSNLDISFTAAPITLSLFHHS